MLMQVSTPFQPLSWNTNMPAPDVPASALVYKFARMELKFDTDAMRGKGLAPYLMWAASSWLTLTAVRSTLAPSRTLKSSARRLMVSIHMRQRVTDRQMVKSYSKGKSWAALGQSPSTSVAPRPTVTSMLNG